MKQMQDNIIPVQAAASVNSISCPSAYWLTASAQVVATGSAGGTLKFQASNDVPNVGNNPQNWSDITGSSVLVTGAGAFLIPKFDICYEFIRLVYTNTGTGTISVNIFTQGL